MTIVPRAPIAAKASRREWIGLAVLTMPCLLYSMDLTVLHLAMPQISADLRPSAAQQLWIVDIYGFLIAGMLLTMGILGDRYGRRRMLMIGAAAFAVTSLLAAFAPTSEAMIAARALQGIAGAALAPSTLSLIRNMFLDDHQRRVAIGIWVAAFSAGGALGPVIGGLLLNHFWWGSVFLLNVPLMALLLIVGPALLPEFREKQPGRLDLVGVGQAIAASLAFVYGMKRIAEDGIQPLPLLFLAAGVALGVMFVRRQRRLPEPLFDVALFSRPAFSAALGVNLLGLFTVLGTFYFIAQYVQLVVGLDPLSAGLWLAPSGLVFALGSMLAPRLARRWSHGTILAWGFTISAIGFAILTQISRDPSSLLAFAGVLLFCAGLAPVGALTTDLVIGAAPPNRAGAASGVSETSFEFGGALGIAVLGSISMAIYRAKLEPGSLAEIPADALESARNSLSAALSSAQSLAPAQAELLTSTARAAYTSSIEVTSGIAALSALLAALLSALLLRGSQPGAHE